jgi:hypothetical protein
MGTCSQSRYSILRSFVTGALVLFVSACTPGTPQVSVHTDEFTPNIQFDGPQARQTDWSTLYDWHLLTLLGKKDNDATYALYFGVSFTAPKKDPFLYAYDEQAQSLPIVVFNSERGGCNMGQCSWYVKSEVVLKEKYLHDHLNAGFRVKMTSRSGASYIVTVTPEMIRLQLEAVDKYRSGSIQAGGAPAQ